MSTNSDELKQEIEDLKTAQATQAATQAGTMSTMTASRLG